MDGFRRSLGGVVAAALLITACGGAATSAPTATPRHPGGSPSASATPGSTTTAPATPRATAAASLAVRASGAPAACQTFAALAGCTAFLRIQALDAKTTQDLEFPADASTSAVLAPGADWPGTLPPGRYRFTAHLDRVGNAAVLPPATPEHWVDRTCQATITVGAKTTKVTLKITFDLDRACRVAATVEPKGSGATPAPTQKPRKTPKPTN